MATTFFALSSAHTSDALDEIRSAVAPLLAAHNDRILLNDALFARVATLHAERAALGLDAESIRLIEKYREDFVRAGAQLDEAGKERMREINADLASLETRFMRNVLDEVNASAVAVESRDALAGLPDDQVAAAAEAAAARGLDGQYVLPLLNTSGQPPLASLDDRALRERIMRASLARGSQAASTTTAR